MSKYFMAAGFLTAATAGVHVILGQFEIVVPMLEAPFGGVPKATLLAAWHIVTVNLVLSATALFAAALKPEKYAVGGVLPAFVAAHYAAWAVVFVVIDLVTTPSDGAGPLLQRLFVDMPQWLMFIPVVLLIIAGIRTGGPAPGELTK